MGGGGLYRKQTRNRVTSVVLLVSKDEQTDIIVGESIGTDTLTNTDPYPEMYELGFV